MIGLERQIEARRIGLKLDTRELISYSYIAKILNKPYNTTKRKIKSGNITVQEAFDIFNNLPFKAKSKFEAFEYLFTEQED